MANEKQIISASEIHHLLITITIYFREETCNTLKPGQSLKLMTRPRTDTWCKGLASHLPTLLKQAGIMDVAGSGIQWSISLLASWGQSSLFSARIQIYPVNYNPWEASEICRSSLEWQMLQQGHYSISMQICQVVTVIEKYVNYSFGLMGLGGFRSAAADCSCFLETEIWMNSNVLPTVRTFPSVHAIAILFLITPF